MERHPMHRPIPLRNGLPESPLRTLVLLLPSSIDCEALSLWCQYRVGCDVVEWATTMEEGVESCRRILPRLLVIDPSIGCGSVERGVALLREEAAGHLLVLDSRPMEVRLAGILSEPGTSYFSRTASSQSLATAMADMLLSGRRAFDPSLAPRIRRTERGFQLDYAAEQRSISILSQREQQVMRLLAEGRTVKQCAEMLGLSESTIDNHKSRLMKKLGIHKSSELAVRAIRDGLLIM
jgi:two-component system, NarL family, response regulator NreC